VVRSENQGFYRNDYQMTVGLSASSGASGVENRRREGNVRIRMGTNEWFVATEIPTLYTCMYQINKVITYEVRGYEY